MKTDDERRCGGKLSPSGLNYRGVVTENATSQVQTPGGWRRPEQVLAVGEQESKRAGGRLGEWDVLPWAINTLRMRSQ